jgi:HK97 family phage major capsid protein
MTLLEMRDKRGLLITDNAELTVKCETEKRKLTDDEKKVFDTNLKTIEQLEKEILVEEELRKVPEAKPIVMSAKEKPFSLIRAINAEVDKNPFDEADKRVFDDGVLEMRKAKVSASGRIILPTEKLYPFEKRATVVSGQAHGTTAGGYAIGYDYKTVLPPLTDYMVLTKAGATYLTGLVGDVRIPTYSGTTVSWELETATVTQGAGTWGQTTLVPKRLTAMLDVSKMFLLQDAVGAEAMLRENLAKAIACKLEATILSNAALSTTKPGGLFYLMADDATYNGAASTASYSVVVKLETAVNTSNALMGNLAYITNAAGKGLLKSTAKVGSSDSVMVMEGNEVNGYPVYVSNGVASGSDFTTSGYGLIFGNWADLLIGQWGGYDLTVDPYTQAAAGTIRLVVNSYFDAIPSRYTTNPSDSPSFAATKLK